MSGEAIAKIIEELVDLKFQRHIETTLKPSPEVARILAAKRETDARRLEQIRSELARLFSE